MSISQAVTVLEVDAGVLNILSKNYLQHSSVSLYDFDVIRYFIGSKSSQVVSKKNLRARSEDSGV